MSRHALLLVALFASVAAAQKEPRRPKLIVGADTNDAQSYYETGLALLKNKPEQAADAFYWSSRLDPNSADAFYARRVALLLSNPIRLAKYWEGDRRTLRSSEIKAIDSLYLHALTINPFLYERLEKQIWDAYIDQEIVRDAERQGVSSVEIDNMLKRYIGRAPAATRAWHAYANGDFNDALDFYARAIGSTTVKSYLRYMRGKLLLQLNQPTPALTELQLAVEEMRKRDVKDFMYVYESKALYEHALGMAHERMNNPAAAKESYGRALQEDLSYSPAHTRLGYMALEAKDTLTAISEFDLAVQLRSDDAGLRYQHGFLLLLVKKHAEAKEQLDKAIALDPWYAASYAALGTAHEAMGKPAEALDAYKKYIAFAAKTDPRRPEILQKVQSLSAASSD
jgi:tetratricopeptide (TPR) repeat protein